MALVDGREAGIFWQSRMGNNTDGIGGNCHRYDVVTADGSGQLRHAHFLVDYGLKLGHRRDGYASEFPTPEGLLARQETGEVAGGGPAAEALLLTHGHEDHLGAIRHAIDMGFRVPPIHCTAFTAQVLDKSLVSAGIDRSLWPEVHVVKSGDKIQVANAEVEFVPLDHMPGATALCIRTPEASVFHTGDYKFDETLVLGDRADPKHLREIGAAGVDMVVSDSTAAAEKVAKVSEDQICASLTKLVARNEGRAVVAGILGTQLDRLVSLGRAAAANDRALVVTGRSLEDNVRALQLSGSDVHRLAGTRILTAAEAQDLPANKALVVTTGAFAQPNAGLARAADRLPGGLWIGQDTTVVIPQRAIGPVKGAHAAMVSKLERLGARVVTAERAKEMGYGPLHQSGHAIESDVRLLYTLLRPRLVVAPVHGNAGQLEANAGIARSLGIGALPIDRNGAVVQVTHRMAKVVGYEDVRRIGAAETGEIKQLPRAPKGQARGFPVAAYRYEELDASGQALMGGNVYATETPTRPRSPRAASKTAYRLGIRRSPSR